MWTTTFRRFVMSTNQACGGLAGCGLVIPHRIRYTIIAGKKPVDTAANAENHRSIVALTLRRSAKPPITPAKTRLLLDRHSRGCTDLFLAATGRWSRRVLNLPVRQHHSAVCRPRLRELKNRHPQVGPSHPRAARDQPPVYTGVLALHPDRDPPRPFHPGVRAELRHQMVEVCLRLRSHFQYAHLLCRPTLYQRYEMADREGQHLVALSHEECVAKLVLRSKNDLARVVIPRRQLLEKHSALPQRQLALVRIQ